MSGGRDFAVKALAIVLTINIMLFFVQLGVYEVNPAGAPQFMNLEDTPLGSFDSGNYTLDEDVTAALPSDAESVSESGNIFTDTWKTFKNWFMDSTGLTYLMAIVTAFPNFLKMIGLPPAAAWALGALWYAFTLLAVMMLIRGD